MAVTKLTNTLSQTALTETLLSMLKEWLERPAGFDSGDDATADVVIDPTKKKEQLMRPEILIEIVSDLMTGTSAGNGGSNRVEKNINIRLSIRVDSTVTNPMLTLNRTGDKLWGYWKSKTTGSAVLGLSGIKRTTLSGPFADHKDSAYAWNYILTCKVTI